MKVWPDLTRQTLAAGVTVCLLVATLVACAPAGVKPSVPSPAATAPALAVAATDTIAFVPPPTGSPTANAFPTAPPTTTPVPPATATVVPTQAPPATLTQPPSSVAAAGEVAVGGGPGVGTSGPTPAAVQLPKPTAASRPESKARRVVVLDPGHGGPEVGAAAYGLAESEVDLAIALKLADLLRAEGYAVVLTRDTDRAVDPRYTGGGYGGGLSFDVQARVDIANAAGADLFLSLHNNGSGDADQSGTEVWYNTGRTFSDRNLALARLVQANLLKRLRALGYPAVDRGIKDDSNFRIYRGQPYNIYVLGPGTGSRRHVPTEMPGVLGESLFISNAADAAILSREQGLDAIAAGYRDAIDAYFTQFPD
ncbi:MAG: N-acetylmuramoyl-L-alanine amidase family protein [Chloroflexota bacterium]